MRQPVAKVVGVAASEDLRLVLNAAKGARVDDAIAVALKGVAIGVFGLRVAPAPGIFYSHRICREHAGRIARASAGSVQTRTCFETTLFSQHTCRTVHPTVTR